MRTLYEYKNQKIIISIYLDIKQMELDGIKFYEDFEKIKENSIEME